MFVHETNSILSETFNYRGIKFETRYTYKKKKRKKLKISKKENNDTKSFYDVQFLFDSIFICTLIKGQ